MDPLLAINGSVGIKGTLGLCMLKWSYRGNSPLCKHTHSSETASQNLKSVIPTLPFMASKGSMELYLGEANFPSVRSSVRPSVRPFVRPSVRSSVRAGYT